MAEKKVTVTQVRSTNRKNKRHALTLQALGLGRIGSKREHIFTPSTAGMLYSVRHLVLVDGAETSKKG